MYTFVWHKGGVNCVFLFMYYSLFIQFAYIVIFTNVICVYSHFYKR